MPWDLAGTSLASDDRLAEAVATWKRTWRDDALSTTENQIDDLATFAAMHVPVVNASRGSKMFESGQGPPVVRNPAIVEAYARLFTSGETLGVVAAGNSNENYGSGPRRLAPMCCSTKWAPAPSRTPVACRCSATGRSRSRRAASTAGGD